jgi:hypothetical protein
MVFALCSVISGAEAENMPYGGKRKKFIKKNPEEGVGPGPHGGRRLQRPHLSGPSGEKCGERLIEKRQKENEFGKEEFMKKILGVSFLALFLAACADSGQGGAADRETGGTSSVPVSVSEPGVAPDPGTRPVVSTGAVTETPARPAPVPPGSEAKPEETAPPAGPNSAQPEPQSELNEQGTQVSPEPRTGDDANPDSVNPRR